MSNIHPASIPYINNGKKINIFLISIIILIIIMLTIIIYIYIMTSRNVKNINYITNIMKTFFNPDNGNKSINIATS